MTLVAYVVGGYPSKATFPDVLRSVAEVADLVEVGVPFTDPMADGVTIQRASRAALAEGVDLPWILDAVDDCPVPIALMGYVNPFLAHPVPPYPLIVPDLPLEETLAGASLVRLVTPVTPEARMHRLIAASTCFVYAVTVTGVTGGSSEPDTAWLDEVRAASHLPVYAGFGIRTREQVDRLAPHVDGVVVGSALIDAIDRGDEPAAFLRQLR